MEINIFFKYYLSIVLSLGFFLGKAQYISVNTSYTPDQLVKDIFFGPQNAGCISVSNVSINGHDFGNGNKSWGYFNKNGSSFEINEGIILSTGSALEAVGPNDYIQTEDARSRFADASWGGDNDLIDILRQSNLNTDNILNATVLEFDFMVSNPNLTHIGFEYMFLSEEYRVGNCKYSDAFAFLIKKAGTTDPYKNIALIPGTNIPVTSNTVTNAGCENEHSEYFGDFNEKETPTNFNGQTKILTAKADITAGILYHIKLVIADHGDKTGLYDSAVFLKAESFAGNKDLGPDRLIAKGNALCEGTSLSLNATVSSVSIYEWYQNGILIKGPSSDGTYIVNTPGLYEVYIDDAGCKLKGSVNIEYTENPLVSSSNTFCNYNDGKPIPINLQSLNSQIINNYKSYFKVNYFQNLGDLTALPDEWSYTEDTTIYVRVESGACTAVTEEVHFYTPKRSQILQDRPICPGSVIRLEAETGFKKYKWMREDGSIIDEGEFVNFVDNIGIGKYFVELTSNNGCSYTQEVNVYASEQPQITHIDVKGNTATVNVTGGTSPYLYSLDNINFQNSNIFTDLPRGLHKIYVKSGDACYTLESEFLIINLINVITPNGDGINDVLDYSDLKIKNNVSIKIFDKYGQAVFKSEGENYIWDGKLSGRNVPTGTYWYLLEWEEPVTEKRISYTGWILVKNRN